MAGVKKMVSSKLRANEDGRNVKEGRKKSREWRATILSYPSDKNLISFQPSPCPRDIMLPHELPECPAVFSRTGCGFADVAMTGAQETRDIVLLKTTDDRLLGLLEWQEMR